MKEEKVLHTRILLTGNDIKRMVKSIVKVSKETKVFVVAHGKRLEINRSNPVIVSSKSYDERR